ncbi:hypothetical protein A4E84_02390 [Streptomyces qaidamensis]|uniref:Uncharacterized protein n=1 Tax=Streptomyces qaidamensis TaxID=1783515 RepID=A0A143BTL0_9ACTN|nr:hypothetical protein A4E84_02390 [Streptomyces qaidamensis]
MRQVAGRAAGRASGEPAAAVGAHQPVEGGVHDPPVVPVRFGRDHSGQRPLLIAARDGVPLAQEGGPRPLDDAVHEDTADGTGGGTSVHVTAALRTAAQRDVRLLSHHAQHRRARAPGGDNGFRTGPRLGVNNEVSGCR